MYPEDAKAAGANRPLAPNTLTRIAAGVERFVIEADEPYIVSYYGPKNGKNFRGQALTEPLPTQTTENRFAIVNPLISPITHTGRSAEHTYELPSLMRHSSAVFCLKNNNKPYRECIRNQP